MSWSMEQWNEQNLSYEHVNILIAIMKQSHRTTKSQELWKNTKAYTIMNERNLSKNLNTNDIDERTLTAT